jgi:predicted nucleic acid-binding protein
LASAVVVLVEAGTALAAALRDGRLSARQHRTAKLRLVRLVEELTIVSINDDLMEKVAVLAEQDALRGYDAVHLVAAMTVGATVMSSADVALCEAASRQRLAVQPLRTRSAGPDAGLQCVHGW